MTAVDAAKEAAIQFTAAKSSRPYCMYLLMKGMDLNEFLFEVRSLLINPDIIDVVILGEGRG